MQAGRSKKKRVDRGKSGGEESKNFPTSIDFLCPIFCSCDGKTDDRSISVQRGKKDGAGGALVVLKGKDDKGEK